MHSPIKKSTNDQHLLLHLHSKMSAIRVMFSSVKPYLLNVSK